MDFAHAGQSVSIKSFLRASRHHNRQYEAAAKRLHHTYVDRFPTPQGATISRELHCGDIVNEMLHQATTYGVKCDIVVFFASNDVRLLKGILRSVRSLPYPSTILAASTVTADLQLVLKWGEGVCDVGDCDTDVAVGD